MMDGKLKKKKWLAFLLPDVLFFVLYGEKQSGEKTREQVECKIA